MLRVWFGSSSSEEVNAKQVKYTPDNTTKMSKMAAEILGCYLREKEMNTNFEHYSEEELADVFTTFYFDVRGKKGEQYKTSTLKNTRHGLDRYLKQHLLQGT